MKREGFEIAYVLPTSDGIIQPDALRAAIRPDSILVSIMMANNEIGTIQPVSELSAIAHENHALFHTDAVQALGKILVDVEQIGCRSGFIFSA